jgi:tetratricopeptide (TPR) repeat protein
VRVDPNDSTTWYCLARSLARGGQFHRAIRHFEMALLLDPNDAGTLGDFAQFLATCREQGLRDYDRAVELAERAYRQDPKSVRCLTLVYTKVAQALANRGDFRQAIEKYNKALDVHANNKLALLQLAVLLAACSEEELRDPQRAVALAERACESTTQPQAEHLSILATAYAEAGQYDKAAAATETAIRLAQAAGNLDQLDGLRRRLKTYRNQ